MTLRFSLNHIAVPLLAPDAFFALAAELGMEGVEIRNDLSGNAILDGTPAASIRAAAEAAGVEILTINALQRFDDWTEARAREARALAGYAAECGAGALVLVPTNDGSGGGEDERAERLRTALAALRPILSEHRLRGLVEPLGFPSCSLRLKSEAVAGIGAVGGDVFRLVHDTFHHHLAGEQSFFPEMTGLVHISGVEDAAIDTAGMLDAHRVLVGEGDRLGNLEQIEALLAAGYGGRFSFEPFAREVQQSTDPAEDLRRSMRYVEGAVSA